jgi:hypothetical protein
MAQPLCQLGSFYSPDTRLNPTLPACQPRPHRPRRIHFPQRGGHKRRAVPALLCTPPNDPQEPSKFEEHRVILGHEFPKLWAPRTKTMGRLYLVLPGLVRFRERRSARSDLPQLERRTMGHFGAVICVWSSVSIVLSISRAGIDQKQLGLSLASRSGRLCMIQAEHHTVTKARTDWFPHTRSLCARGWRGVVPPLSSRTR